MKKKLETSVVIKLTNEDRTLILTDVDKFYYGITICETKKADKKKIVNYSHILFSKYKFAQILKNIYQGEEEFRQYFSCECRSEVLRIWHTPKGKDKDDIEEWMFEIFDNYFLKCPRGIKDSISLDKHNLYALCDAINLDGRSDRCEKLHKEEVAEFYQRMTSMGWQFTNCYVQ